jgi:hypothetical protein
VHAVGSASVLENLKIIQQQGDRVQPPHRCGTMEVVNIDFLLNLTHPTYGHSLSFHIGATEEYIYS